MSIEGAGDIAGWPDEQVLVVHYHRPDADYERWNLWTWHEGGDGQAVPLQKETDFGTFAVVSPAPGTARQGLIVRKGNWEAKDVDQDRWIELDDDGFTEVWLVAGDQRVFRDPAAVDLSVRVAGAFLDDSDSIFMTITGTPGPGMLDRIDVLLDGEASGYDIVRTIQRDGATRGIVYELVLDEPVAFDDVSNLSLALPGVDETTVYARDVLMEERFTALDAELGSFHSDTSTTFRVWSPVSESVELLLFERAGQNRPTRTVTLSHEGRGVWEATVAGDLHGTYYQYAYQSYGERRVAPDIHCRAATSDSRRSMVVDLLRVEPEGWGTVEPPRLAQPTDEVIYEIHVRDYSIADPSAEAGMRGMYLGMLHDGEVETPNGTVRTGLSHLRELGVTAVHLLPIHDYSGARDEYNWGYWTALFNVPESNYATDPDDPTSPISELKRAIHGLHEAGIRVILDVVYNHTSSSFEWSPFYQSVPYYYFRTTVDGRLRNDAGVGNAIADERPMVRKYIGDSLVYWTQQYRIDGYRFDLIGTHQPESVREWVERVRTIRPDLTIYGEPWTGGGPLYFPKGAQRDMGLAVFNDHHRNAIRGDLDGTGLGYATGPGGDIGSIRNGVAGAIDDFTDDPTETINYVSAHDNRTFWDKLEYSLPDATDAEMRAMHKLAHGIMLTSQGIAFLHGGADFARTKGGNHNSYNAGDEVNKFDWPRKGAYRDVFEYVRGLIELRRAHPAFRMADRDDVRQSLSFLPSTVTTDRRVIAFTLDGEALGDSWATILVAYNGTPDEQVVQLPPGAWTQVVDHERAGVERIAIRRSSVTMEPYSMAVLQR
ncbi:MAG: type I pullulanase [Planctomycetota bacterium]